MKNFLDTIWCSICLYICYRSLSEFPRRTRKIWNTRALAPGVWHLSFLHSYITFPTIDGFIQWIQIIPVVCSNNYVQFRCYWLLIHKSRINVIKMSLINFNRCLSCLTIFRPATAPKPNKRVRNSPCMAMNVRSIFLICVSIISNDCGIYQTLSMCSTEFWYSLGCSA